MKDRQKSDGQLLQEVEELRLQNLELESQLKEKEKTVRKLLHDLKAPLISILGYADILLEGYADKIPEEVVKYILKLKKAGYRLRDMIDGSQKSL